MHSSAFVWCLILTSFKHSLLSELSWNSAVPRIQRGYIPLDLVATLFFSSPSQSTNFHSIFTIDFQPGAEFTHSIMHSKFTFALSLPFILSLVGPTLCFDTAGSLAAVLDNLPSVDYGSHHYIERRDATQVNSLRAQEAALEADAEIAEIRAATKKKKLLLEEQVAQAGGTPDLKQKPIGSGLSMNTQVIDPKSPTAGQSGDKKPKKNQKGVQNPKDKKIKPKNKKIQNTDLNKNKKQKKPKDSTLKKHPKNKKPKDPNAKLNKDKNLKKSKSKNPKDKKTKDQNLKGKKPKDKKPKDQTVKGKKPKTPKDKTKKPHHDSSNQGNQSTHRDHKSSQNGGSSRKHDHSADTTKPKSKPNNPNTSSIKKPKTPKAGVSRRDSTGRGFLRE